MNVSNCFSGNIIKVKTTGVVNKNSKCPKCGCEVIVAKYNSKIWDDEAMWYDKCIPVIKRTCTFCQYYWYENVKNLNEDKNG